MQSRGKNLNDILRIIRFSPKQRLAIFLAQPHETRAAILLRLTKRMLYDVLISIPDQELVPTLEHLDPDEATNVIHVLPLKRQQRIIKKFNTDLQENIRILTQFDPKTAAGIMNVNYIQVDVHDKVFVVAKKFKAHEKRTGRLPSIIVMKNGNVAGYMLGHQLGFAASTDSVKKYTKKISTIPYNMGHDDVLKMFQEHPHNKIVVIGERKNAIDIIYSDDMLHILEEQKSASLYNFAGVHEEETVLDSVRIKVMSRYKWLIVNLGTAFFAAFTVGLFDETISQYVLLAVYMPIVAGMGGNAATQTLAVLVRGIALHQIDLKTALPTLRKEIIAGVINGIINGVIVAVVVLLFNNDLRIAFILGVAMVINLLVAAFFGTLVPLIMQKLGKDPATSATIFITTATDVLGFLAFLGLATLILT